MKTKTASQKVEHESIFPEGDRGVEDTGSWFAEQGKLCRQYRRFRDGKLDCHQVVNDGNNFRFYSEGKYVSEGIIKKSIEGKLIW